MRPVMLLLVDLAQIYKLYCSKVYSYDLAFIATFWNRLNDALSFIKRFVSWSLFLAE